MASLPQVARSDTHDRSDRLVGCFVGLVRDPGIPGRHNFVVCGCLWFIIFLPCS